MELRQSVSNGILLFLTILAISDIIALLPGGFIVEKFANNPDIANFVPTMTGLMYWFLYFLLMHLVTVPVSFLLTAIYKSLNRGSGIM